MRKLSTERRAAILSALVEGNSIAATCRMRTVNKVTVLRLLADAGTLAAQYHDLTVRDLTTERVEADEIWAFCYARKQNVPTEKRGQLGYGDVWTWTAMDADSKLMISYLVGDRGTGYATEFMHDLAGRLKDRVQLTTDGHRPYFQAVPDAFGSNIDFARLVKVYGKPVGSKSRPDVPDVCIGCVRDAQIGNPNPAFISTSFAERSNLTMRMNIRRFTRLTNAHSKKMANHCHAVALHYFHYNFIRKHQTIKTTPAVMAGIAEKPWTLVDFVKMLEKEEELLGGRLTDYKPAASKKAGA